MLEGMSCLLTAVRRTRRRSFRDEGLGLELDLPARVEQAGDDEERARRAHGAEDLAVGAADFLPVVRLGEVGPRADDVLGPRPDVGQGGDDDLEAPLRLLVRVDGRLALAGHDRRRARDVDVRPDPHGPRVADGGDERRLGWDDPPLHRRSIATWTRWRRSRHGRCRRWPWAFSVAGTRKRRTDLVSKIFAGPR